MNPLKRTVYTDPPITGQTRSGSTALAESQVDQEEYFGPLHCAHGASFHTWGVADGLEVSTDLGAADVQVQPGTALDSKGRAIVLAAGGQAVIDPNADPNSVVNIATVGVNTNGITLPTRTLSSGNYAVTIRFRETFSTGSGHQHNLLHTPWLLLQPTASLPPDDGVVLVLAEVTIGANGHVTALREGNRHQAGLPAGSLSLRRPLSATNPLSVGQASAAQLRARADDGLDISGPQQSASTTWLSIDGSTGFTGIGIRQPQTRLHVAGGLRIDGETNLQGPLIVAGDAELQGVLRNPIRFTSAWSGFPDGATNRAEISNDIGTFKTLMIVGNKSAGVGRRVSVWDRLEVNGALTATHLEVNGGGGGSIDLTVNGRLQSNNNDGGLWIASDRFVGGHSINNIGFWNGGAWRLSVQPNGDSFVVGNFLVVSGAGGEAAYIGGDGAANDAQIGSMNPTVTTLAVWNWNGGAAMNVACRQLFQSSDQRLKTNVAQLTDALARLGRLRGVSFEWKAPAGGSTGGRSIGFIGQELETVFPDLVTKRGDEDSRFIDYNGVTAVIVEAVKELIARTNGLNQRVGEIESRSA